MRVEHCLTLWFHSAGVSCVLRFSLSLAFQKSSPETQPQLVLGLFFAESFPELPCTFPYLILNVCGDVSDGPCLWTLPLSLFSLLRPSSLFGTWSLSGIGQNLLWVTRTSLAIASPILSSRCCFLPPRQSHCPVVPSLQLVLSLLPACSVPLHTNAFLCSYVELKSLGVLCLAVFWRIAQDRKCLPFNRSAYCSWNDTNGFYSNNF